MDSIARTYGLENRPVVVHVDKDSGIARLSGEQPARNILVKKSKFRKTCFRDENNGPPNPSKARNGSLRVLQPWRIIDHWSALRLIGPHCWILSVTGLQLQTRIFIQDIFGCQIQVPKTLSQESEPCTFFERPETHRAVFAMLWTPDRTQ